MTFSLSSLTLCRSARILSTVCGIFRRCSSKASFRIRNKLVLTLKPTMSGVRSSGWGRIPADVICSSSTSLGNRKAWMSVIVSSRWNGLTAASSRRRLIVRARYFVSFILWQYEMTLPSKRCSCPLGTAAESSVSSPRHIGLTNPVYPPPHLALYRVQAFITLYISFPHSL